MAKLDGQLFARFSLDYADHPKIIGLSDAAFRAHVEMILYARRQETDGVIPARLAQRYENPAGNLDQNPLGLSPVQELLHNDPEAPSLTRLESGNYLLHGYADMQETKEQISLRRKASRANGARGGRPRKNLDKTQGVTQNLTGSKAETETETETDKGGGYVVHPVAPSAAEAADHEPAFIDVELPLEEPDVPDTGKYPADFTAFWDIYPRRNGKGAACAAFVKAKKRATVQQIIDGATRLRDDPNLPADRSLIPMPATWLNQDRWDDDPLPARGQDMSTSQRRLMHAAQEAERFTAPPAPDDVFAAYLDSQPRKELT